MVQEYTVKPQKVKVLQWTGENQREMHDFLGGIPNQYIQTHGEHFIIDHTRVVGGLIIKTAEGELTANINDYIIKGVNGKYYPCNPESFAASFDEANKKEGLSFGEAQEAMQANHGKKAGRAGWNGKGMWVAYTEGETIAAHEFWNAHSAEFAASNGGSAQVGAYYVFKSAQGVLELGWRPTSADMLAKDWCIID